MDAENQALEEIFNHLKNKASLKQKTYRNIVEVFKMLKKEASDITKKLQQKIKKVDSSISVSLTEKNEFEFHIKFAGDLLIFSLQSNIVTFNSEYVIMKSDYVKESTDRGYFGQIYVYNFLADSIKYNRMEDPGYLIGRLLVNSESHFYVEGTEQLSFLFTDIQNNIISEQWLRLLVEKAMLSSISNDLIGANYPDIQNTTLRHKMKDNVPMGQGQKLGFHMSYMNEIK
ncbi:hypothetical protein QQ008_09360 [Fulvivirgaceae bacterium BMA10]|uniref:Uncharacterized protein n=1 Tax=Splendidivirga corallicola TaxID=3051826 RepID=A0ABT8KMX3_9BACT|nr:hypothetical protein [Fulvivirgaceae bacterium BMA10]